MPRVFINLEAGCLQVNLMSTNAQINQLKYTILYYTILIKDEIIKHLNIFKLINGSQHGFTLHKAGHV